MRHSVVVRLFVLCALAGCGRFGFGAHDAADASVAIDTAIDDAPADAPPPTGPFGAAVAVASLNTAGAEDDASFTADQLEAFFDSGRAGGLGGGDIWTAKRAVATDPWGTATNVGVLNTSGDDATPEVSRDGLTLYYVTNGAAGAKDVFISTRADRTAAWSPRMPVGTPISSGADESGPTLTPDGLVLYFSRDTNGEDMFVSVRATTSAAWGTPMPLTALNTASFDGEPFINGTNTLLIWSSDRGGNRDLWLARRADATAAWGAAQPISELNTAADEGDPWLSPDEHVLYFSRGTDIYMATR